MSEPTPTPVGLYRAVESLRETATEIEDNDSRLICRELLENLIDELDTAFIEELSISTPPHENPWQTAVVPEDEEFIEYMMLLDNDD